MTDQTFFILLMLYLLVGYFVAFCLYVTREGYDLDRPRTTENFWFSIFFLPEVGSLALLLWPLYLLFRICRLVLKWNSTK